MATHTSIVIRKVDDIRIGRRFGPFSGWYLVTSVAGRLVLWCRVRKLCVVDGWAALRLQQNGTEAQECQDYTDESC